MGEDESEIEKRNTLAVWVSIAADAKDEGDIKRVFLAAAKPQVGGREVEVADGVDDLFKEASAAHYMPPRFLASLFLPLSPSLSRPPPMHITHKGAPEGSARGAPAIPVHSGAADSRADRGSGAQRPPCEPRQRWACRGR